MNAADNWSLNGFSYCITNLAKNTNQSKISGAQITVCCGKVDWCEPYNPYFWTFMLLL